MNLERNITEYIPLISVVMSVYNSEAYLSEAIDSVLTQSFRDFEFIIINDGSTDKSSDILASYNDDRMIILNQQNKGLSHALNFGIRNAKGKYIARMDADDISLPSRIEEQVVFLENHDDYVLVGASAILISKDGQSLYTCNNPETWDEIYAALPETSFFHSSVMFRKSAWQKAGGYREDIRHFFEDMLLWNEFAKLGKMHNIQKALIRYRLVPSSISNTNKKNRQFITQLSNRLMKFQKLTEDDKRKLLQIANEGAKTKLLNYHLTLASIYLNQNPNRFMAVWHVVKAFRYKAFHTSNFFYLLLCLLPRATAARVRALCHLTKAKL